MATCALGTLAWAASYQDGFAAYERGDYRQAYDIWLPLADGGDSDAQFGVGVILDNGQGVTENDTEAAKWYRLAAERGNSDAQFNLALLYDSGKGIEVNKTEAAYWYRKAATSGHVGAQYNIALMYENGDGIDRDPVQAAFWYQKAAEQGHAKAQNNLGVLYDKGVGVTENKVEAARWYAAAAAQGFARAEFNLGVMYDFGTGVPLDDTKAAYWYRKAAEQGDAEAQFNLALMLDAGEGVTIDKAEASVWYRKAAEQGNAAAQNNLGVLLESGDGVARAPSEAGYWYEKAALQGNTSAMRNLAALFRDGQGVPQDLIEAYKWLSIAIDSMGSGPDREATLEDRSDLGERMERTEVREARRRADDWLKNSGPGSAVPRVASTGPTAPPPPDRSRTELDSTGSGFFVTAGGLVLTNQHVVAACSELKLRLGRERVGTATVVATDPSHDLALLRSSTVPPAVANFRMGRPPRPGDDVVAIGYPLRGLLSSEANVATGTISANAGLRDDPNYFQVSAPVQPGNSGGPLLDRSGHVVGIVSAKLDALEVVDAYGDIPQNVNFAIKGDVALSFLNTNQVTPIAAPSETVLAAADVGEQAQRFTVLVECWK
ncbi:trypsin-like peptidase domain-containing protein [Zavarzinia sp.]|uniref:trypsin-like peptidase domain-containing protein n=1 Tax=Zavarzinia sp. TaxID=2027920 RepID=UPI0035621271